MLGDEGMDSICQAIANGIPYNSLIEELESRMDYGMEYAQAISDVIAILERSEE